MPLTPADVRRAAFTRISIGRRGYDESQVDEFLAEVEREMRRLIDDNQALKGRLALDGPEESSGDMRAEIAGLLAELSKAREERDLAAGRVHRLRVELRSATGPPPADRARPVSGDGPSAQVLALAERAAGDNVRAARHEAHLLVANARDRAAGLISDAQLKASTITGNARHRHAQAVNDLDAKRAAILGEIETLGGIAQAHQQALTRLVTQRLREMTDEAARVVPRYHG